MQQKQVMANNEVSIIQSLVRDSDPSAIYHMFSTIETRSDVEHLREKINLETAIMDAFRKGFNISVDSGTVKDFYEAVKIPYRTNGRSLTLLEIATFINYANNNGDYGFVIEIYENEILNNSIHVDELATLSPIFSELYAIALNGTDRHDEARDWVLEQELEDVSAVKSLMASSFNKQYFNEGEKDIRLLEEALRLYKEAWLETGDYYPGENVLNTLEHLGRFKEIKFFSSQKISFRFQ